MSRRFQGKMVIQPVIAAAAVSLAALAAAGAAGAQPPPPGDPCSPASLMRSHADGINRTADLLDSNPEIQQAFRDARSGGDMNERHQKLMDYLQSHPDVLEKYKGTHQGFKDLANRCGVSVPDDMPLGGPQPGA